MQGRWSLRLQTLALELGAGTKTGYVIGRTGTQKRGRVMPRTRGKVRLISTVVLMTCVACIIGSCGRTTSVVPSPGTLHWSAYQRFGLLAFTDPGGKVVGFALGESHGKGNCAVVAYRTVVGRAPGLATIRLGMPSSDIEARLGHPSAYAAKRFLEYGTVRNDVLLLEKGFRSFEFEQNRLVKARELYTDFRLSNGLRYGMSMSQLTATCGSPDVTGTGDEVDISILHAPPSM